VVLGKHDEEGSLDGDNMAHVRKTNQTFYQYHNLPNYLEHANTRYFESDYINKCSYAWIRFYSEPQSGGEFLLKPKIIELGPMEYCDYLLLTNDLQKLHVTINGNILDMEFLITLDRKECSEIKTKNWNFHEFNESLVYRKKLKRETKNRG